MSRIVGIDLGTSTSEIAILRDGTPYVIPNDCGNKITPSVVGLLENGEIVVGEAAKEQLLLRPEETIIEVKRMMGTSENIRLGDKQYTPQEISSYILKYLVKCASEHLGESIDRAVITVPAYFSDEQRRATVEAGNIAGLKVERIINEPTAASLDYGIDHMEDIKNVMVYDLGGGTLDVTVLEMFEGVLEVKASCGNNKLGGKDFDQCLIDYFIDIMMDRHSVDVSSDPRAMMRLKEASEKCKIALSHEEYYEVTLPFIADLKGVPISFHEEVTRAKFEELIGGLVDSTVTQINSSMKDSGLKIEEIDIILLVGGSTRIPYVKEFLKKVTGKSPKQLVDPDMAVVRGAAIQAGILNEELSSETDIIITDVCPYTLGVNTLAFIGGFPMPDMFDIIIPRNVTIPVVKEKIYTPVHDYQEKVEIKVYQGEYRIASQNNFLGEFTINDLPSEIASEQKIKVAFSYDVNGILQVDATILKTGSKVSITVETTGVAAYEEVNSENWKSMPTAKKYSAVIRKADKMLKNMEEEMEENINQPMIETLLLKLKNGIVSGVDENELGEIKEQLFDLLLEVSEDMDD